MAAPPFGAPPFRQLLQGHPRHREAQGDAFATEWLIFLPVSKLSEKIEWTTENAH